MCRKGETNPQVSGINPWNCTEKLNLIGATAMPVSSVGKHASESLDFPGEPQMQRVARSRRNWDCPGSK
jgi:hypothetical protein